MIINDLFPAVGLNSLTLLRKSTMGKVVQIIVTVLCLNMYVECGVSDCIEFLGHYTCIFTTNEVYFPAEERSKVRTLYS